MSNNPTKIFLIIIAMCRNNSGAVIPQSLRVKGGHNKTLGEFPYVVRMEIQATVSMERTRDYHYHKCTGSVLTPTATLTAGHCCAEELQTHEKIASVDISMKHVVRYRIATAEEDKFSDVLSCTYLPSARDVYHPVIFDDLAIARTEPIQLSSYGRISSIDYRSLYGLQVTLMGYGLTNHSKMDDKTDTLTLGLPLQVVGGMIIPCDEELQFPSLCATSTCDNPHGVLAPGDSGGPVVHSTGIVGVNSKSYFELIKKDPKFLPIPTQIIIMPLSPYLDWLTRSMKEHQP